MGTTTCGSPNALNSSPDFTPPSPSVHLDPAAAAAPPLLPRRCGALTPSPLEQQIFVYFFPLVAFFFFF